MAALFFCTALDKTVPIRYNKSHDAERAFQNIYFHSKNRDLRRTAEPSGAGALGCMNGAKAFHNGEDKAR